MDRIYKGNLQCAICGNDHHFEYNDDKSFIKCTSCGKEYHGGYKELFDLNQGNINEMKKKIAADYKKIIIEKMNVNALGLGTKNNK